MKKKAAAAKVSTEQDCSGEEHDVANGARMPSEIALQGQEEEGGDVVGEGGAADDAKKKKKKKKGVKQTEPPSIPIAKFFPDGRYPEGEWQSYNDEYGSL
jgi:hypothetical protein